MTQKEFEERTGLKLSADGYTEVEECSLSKFGCKYRK